MTLPIKYIHFETVDSTNNWAKQNSDQCSQEGLTVITADFQTAGRGRYSKQWHSKEKQNLLATYVFFLNAEQIDTVKLVQLLAKATVNLLNVWKIPAIIKWPNDVLVNQKKIAGILCETIHNNKKLVVIEGIGLNINKPEEELKLIDQPATSMLVETGHTQSIEKVLEQLTKFFVEELKISQIIN